MGAAGKIVSVFGSSRPAPEDAEYTLAYDVGRELANAGFVVCNGGYGGTMEASARGARECPSSDLPANGRTVGVVANAFGGRSANRWIDRIITVDTLVDRLLKLVSLGDAYVVLRGGTGTMLEFAAVWEFMNKNMMQEKPIIVLGTFWDDVIKTLSSELELEGLARCAHYVTAVRTPGECAAALRSRLIER